jgi:prepilin-type processing-associated H-X9-DG protein
MSPKKHLGTTLLEVLIVVAIIGILLGLTVPAVQKVRELMLRTECQNNLRQIGLGSHHYHTTVGSFPPGIRFKNAKDPLLFSSWLTNLLPYVEQGDLWAATEAAYKQQKLFFVNPPHIGLSTVMRLYSCPADGRSDRAQISQIDKRLVAFTGYLGVEGQDLFSQNGIMYRDSYIRITDISDGTSQTLLAGERPPSTDFQFGWWYAGSGQNGTGSGDMILGVQEFNTIEFTYPCGPGPFTFAPGNVANQCDMFHFWSLHSGGAHFLFADGSVHFLTYSVAPMLPALASRAGGETASYSD